MVHKIETLLALMGMVGILAVAAARLRFPFPVLLVLAGLAIGLVPRLPAITINPDLVLVVVLPPLLFSAAWNFPWNEFRQNLTPIFALAVLLVLATMTAVAFTASWIVPGMTLAAGFVLGAIISPPDAVSASAILRPLRVPRRLMTVLEGESLVNDSSGLVAYHFAVAAVVTGSFSLAGATVAFAWTSVGGVLLGWVVGLVAVRIHNKLTDPAVEITLTILTPYLAYLGAVQFGFSGVLAVVAAGLQVGHNSWTALTPESRLQRDAVWKFIEFLLNGLVFVLIGLEIPQIVKQLDVISLPQAIGLGAVISFVVIGIRFLLLPPMIWFEKFFARKETRQVPPLSPKALFVGSCAGMRGVVSMAAALAVPLTVADGADFPARHIILFLTFCVIFVTLVLQGLSLPWIVKRLGISEHAENYRSEIEARLSVLSEILAELDRQVPKATNPSEIKKLDFWRRHYSERSKQITARLEILDNPEFAISAADQELFPKIMHHARWHLNNLRAQGQISEEVRRCVEYDFDLEEQRLWRILKGHSRPD